MGGPGSSNRWRYGSKSSTDDYRAVDVRRWARVGMLRPGYWGGWQWTRNGEVVASIRMRAEEDRVIFIYRHRSGGEEWKDEEYPVRIVRTPCNLGGTRPWFICPALGCGRRVAILYGGGIFACRHCYQFAYASARDDAGDRATRRADRIRARLGWEPGTLNANVRNTRPVCDRNGFVGVTTRTRCALAKKTGRCKNSRLSVSRWQRDDGRLLAFDEMRCRRIEGTHCPRRARDADPC